ncbi:MAG: molybdenum cofactor guanylyltransferase [Parvibaculum sp.]
MKPSGAIIAGGASRRMGGGEKALALFRGKPLVQNVIDRVSGQVGRLSINVREGSLGRYDSYRDAGIVILADSFGSGAGPLGGVVTALDWMAAARDSDWLATFPADTPLLPADMVAVMMKQRQGETPVVAVAGGRIQSLCALWPLSCRGALRRGLEAESFRSVWWTLKELGARECQFPDEAAFLNINTPEDLAGAEKPA